MMNHIGFDAQNGPYQGDEQKIKIKEKLPNVPHNVQLNVLANPEKPIPQQTATENKPGFFSKPKPPSPQQIAQLPPQIAQSQTTPNPLSNGRDTSGNVVSPNKVKLELQANPSNLIQTQTNEEITDNFIKITPDVFVKQVFEEVKRIIATNNSTNKTDIINIIDKCINYINEHKERIIFTEGSSNLENSKLYYELVQGFCYNVAYIFRDILDKKPNSDKLSLFQNQYNALCQTYNKIVGNSAEVIRELKDEIQRSNCQNKKLSEIQEIIAADFNKIIAEQNAKLTDLQAKCPAGDCGLDDDFDESECEECDEKPVPEALQDQASQQPTPLNPAKVAVAIVAAEDKKKLKIINSNGEINNAFNSSKIAELEQTISEKENVIQTNQNEIEKLKQQLTKLQTNTTQSAESIKAKEELTIQLAALEATQNELAQTHEKSKLDLEEAQSKLNIQIQQAQVEKNDILDEKTKELEELKLQLTNSKDKYSRQIEEAQAAKAATNVEIERIKAEKNAALKAAKVENNASLAKKNAELQNALQAQKKSNSSSQAKNAEINKLNEEIQRLIDINDKDIQAQLAEKKIAEEAEAKAEKEKRQTILENIQNLKIDFDKLNINQEKKQENQAKIKEFNNMFNIPENSSKSTEELQKLYNKINKQYINLKEDLGGQVRTFIRSKGYTTDGGTKCGTDTAIKDGDSPNVKINYYKLIEESKYALKDLIKKDQIQPYGPYYNFFECKDTNEQVYNQVIDMINQVYEGYHVAFFGYGYSGSGKSYTLLNNNNGDNKGILIQFINQALSTGATITVDKVFELYNEVNVDTSGQISLNPKTNKTNKTLIKTLITPTITNITTQNITDLLKNIEDSRKAANRISKTMNNPESSRSHLFIKLKIANKGKTGYLTICDMGGRENPIEILTNTTIDTQTKPPTKPPTKPEKLTIQQITGLSTTKSIFNSAVSAKITNYELYTEPTKSTEPKETINTKISQIITLCKQGIYINESINHLIYYFQSKIKQEKPEIVKLVNVRKEIIDGEITNFDDYNKDYNINFAMELDGKGVCCIDPVNLDKTKLTNFQTLVKNKFVHTTNVDYIDFLLKNTECYPIFTKPPADLQATLTPQNDLIGMIRVLKEIENSENSENPKKSDNPSKFAVFACIREDYDQYEKSGGKRDTLIDNNIKTLQFAESISSSVSST